MATGKKPNPEMGKWSLWRYFSVVPSIRPYLPATAIFTKENVKQYMNKYKVIYIKPSGGWGGKGIIKAWTKANGYSYVLERGNVQSTRTLDQLFAQINKLRGDRLYIVQQAIHLAEMNGRPFDIRFMMMRNAQGKWQYAGILAKVAGSQSIITNVARGRGYVMEVEPALRQSLKLSNQQIARLKQSMIKLGHATVNRFDSYNYYYNIGLDLAIDKNGKLWMIEENTAPALYLFNKLQDKTMYRNLMGILAARRRKKSQPTQKQAQSIRNRDLPKKGKQTNGNVNKK